MSKQPLTFKKVKELTNKRTDPIQHPDYRVDLEKSREELHEMHLTFMSTVSDLIDALNSYFEKLLREVEDE